MFQLDRRIAETLDTFFEEVQPQTYNGLFEFILNWTIAELFEFFLK